MLIARRTLVPVAMILVLAIATWPIAGLTQATPDTDGGLGCTVWRDRGTPPDMPVPAGCLTSPPWWEAWPDCEMTPVNSVPSPKRRDLDFLPWFEVPMGQVTATAYIWFGNRPLTAGGQFPDGGYAKTLWNTDQRVQDFRITASLPDDPAHAGVMVYESMDANDHGAYNEFYLSLDVPAAGCWTFTVSGKTVDGAPLRGQFTYIVVG